jgi:hypothetical protein
MHYGKEGIYTSEALNMWKELKNNGLAFGKNR